MKPQPESNAVRYPDEIVSSVWSIPLLEIVSLYLRQQTRCGNDYLLELTIRRKA